MKQEQAQELYTEYREGTLSPALRLALEQHWAADPDARADYDAFALVYDLLEQPQTDLADVPSGFRARVLERAAAQTRRPAPSVWDWLRGPRLAGIGAVCAALAGIGLMTGRPVHPTSTGGFSVVTPPPSAGPDAVIEGVSSQAAPEGGQQYLLRVHLPDTVPSATVNAIILTDLAQIGDAGGRAAAMPALAQPQALTSEEEMQIPVTLVHLPPPGATLNMLVQWTPDDKTLPPGAQAVFEPLLPAGSAPVPTTGGEFYQTLRGLAAAYGVTVIVDAEQGPSVLAPAPSGSDALTALQSVAHPLGYEVQDLGENTYQVYKP